MAGRRGGREQPAVTLGSAGKRLAGILRSVTGAPVHGCAVRDVEARFSMVALRLAGRGGTPGGLPTHWRPACRPCAMPAVHCATRAHPHGCGQGQQLSCGCGRHPQPCSRPGRTRPPAHHRWMPPQQPSAADLCQVISPAPLPCGAARRWRDRGWPMHVASASAAGAGARKAALRCRGWRSWSSRLRWHVCTVAEATAALSLAVRCCLTAPVCRPARRSDATGQWHRQSYRHHMDAPQITHLAARVRRPQWADADGP